MGDREFNYKAWADVDLDKKPDPPKYDNTGFPVIFTEFINSMTDYE